MKTAAAQDQREREILREQNEADAKLMAEAFTAMPDLDPYQLDVKHPPTVDRRIREALRELRNSEAGGVKGDSEDGIGAHYVFYERATIAMICDLLDEALELDATRAAIAGAGRLVTTDDSEEIGRIVDDLDEHPHRVVVRLLTAERKIKELEERSILHARPHGAAR